MTDQELRMYIRRAREVPRSAQDRRIESLARELLSCRRVVRKNHRWHQQFDDGAGYKGSELEADNLGALKGIT